MRIIGTLILIVIVFGSYFVIKEVSNLKARVTNAEFTLEFVKRDILEELREESGTSTIPEELLPQNETGTSIPTSIIFNATSSPLLRPEAKLTLVTEAITKNIEGFIIFKIKIFTGDANSYTAIEPSGFFEMVPESGSNIKALKTTGQFNSMPPKTSISGTVTFKIDPEQSKVIFQIGSENNFKFYEFDFGKRSYKEVVLG